MTIQVSVYDSISIHSDTWKCRFPCIFTSHTQWLTWRSGFPCIILSLYNSDHSWPPPSHHIFITIKQHVNVWSILAHCPDPALYLSASPRRWPRFSSVFAAARSSPGGATSRRPRPAPGWTDPCWWNTAAAIPSPVPDLMQFQNKNTNHLIPKKCTILLFG